MADAVSEEKDTVEAKLDLSKFNFLLNFKNDEVEKQEGRRIGKYNEQKEDSECQESEEQGENSGKKRHAKDLQSEILLDFFKEYDVVDLWELDEDMFVERCFSLLESLTVSKLATDRQLAVEKLLPYLSLVEKSEEKINKALPIICSLSEDQDISVKCWFIDMIPQLVLFCKENRPCASNVVKQILVPYALKCFTATQLLVRQVGHASLNTLLENNLIENSQLSEWVCPFVAQCVLSSDSSIEVQRADLSFLVKILPFVGSDLTVRFFLEPFIAMCANPEKEIRKICASNLLTFARFVGEELSDSPLLQSFLNLCSDHQNLDVCIPCIEAFSEIARLVNIKIRKELLTDVFIQLFESGVAAIISSASEEIGNFSLTFASSSDCRSLPLRESGNTSELLDNEGQEVSDSSNSVSSTTNCNKNHTAMHTNMLNHNLNLPSCVTEIFNDEASTHYFSNKMHRPYRNELKGRQKSFKRTQINFYDFSFSDDDFSIAICNLEKNTNYVSDENLFNNFQYWKFPHPEIELEAKDHLQNSDFSSKNSVISESVDYADQTVPIQMAEDVNFLDTQHKVQFEQFRRRSNMMIGSNRSSRKEIRNLTESQDIIPPRLLDMYLKICHSTIDYEEPCARSFPAIAYAVGNKNWFILRDAFLRFERSEKRVRKIIAAKFHELVMMLDQATFKKDLSPCFKNFLVIDFDEVRVKVFEHLSDILRYGGDNARVTFSSAMATLSLKSSGRNWRVEFTLAEQLASAIELYDTTEVNRIYLPFALDLLKNRISVTRQAAIELLAVILKHLLTDKATSDVVASTLCNLVQDYKNAQKWNCRQLYVHFSEQIAIKQSLSIDMYVEKIVPHLLALAWDSVPNVRLSVARCLARSLVPLGYFPSIESSHGQLLTQVLFSLQSDIERDVRNFAVLVPVVKTNSEDPKSNDS